jgi:hypothetical protein
MCFGTDWTGLKKHMPDRQVSYLAWALTGERGHI